MPLVRSRRDGGEGDGAQDGGVRERGRGGDNAVGDAVVDRWRPCRWGVEFELAVGWRNLEEGREARLCTRVLFLLDRED